LHGVPLDEAALADYRALPPNTTPPPLLSSSVLCRDAEDAHNLGSAFYGSREGYANTHDLPQFKDFMGAVAAGPCADTEGQGDAPFSV